MHQLTPLSGRAHPPSSGWIGSRFMIGSRFLIATALTLMACPSCSTVVSTPASALASCAVEVAQRADTAVVAATATSAEPAAELPPGLRAHLESTAARGIDTCLAIVTPQGKLAAFDLTPRRPSGQTENGPSRASKVSRNLDALEAQLTNQAQTSDGLDPLATLERSVRLHPTPGTLYLISSAVATKAPVDLRQLGWNLDPESQAVGLSLEGWLPALHGWRVHLVGIGDVAGKQPQLTPPLRQLLRSWWLAICQYAGAAQCIVDPELLNNAPPRSRNDVPIVPLPAPTVGEGSVTLPTALLFSIDSAVIGPYADAALRDVVSTALGSTRVVNVAGYTDAATGTRVHNLRLSKARAEAVAQRLIDLGLPADRLGRVEGLGPGEASKAREMADPGQISRDRKVQITYSDVKETNGHEHQ